MLLLHLVMIYYVRYIDYAYSFIKSSKLYKYYTVNLEKKNMTVRAIFVVTFSPSSYHIIYLSIEIRLTHSCTVLINNVCQV